ncbi:MAG TPA: NDP-sugar synthase [Solirubrobacterales bacterium]|nr:NDP-sugar synthase [Solirubrobacterales bacterium]
MQAVVLVGGEGTRLRPLTADVPKPAVTLVDRPFLAFFVEWLGRHGVEEVVLACGFKPDVLRRALGDEHAGLPLRYVVEPERRGTAGAIRFAAEQLGDSLGERFLALNGDVLADLDLTALQRAHAERGARATIALHPADDSSAYGLVRRGPAGEVLEFLEKTGEPEPGEVNAGAYVLERSVLDLIPAGREVSIEREVFPRLVGEGLSAELLDGYWMDIGTRERYLQASWDILESRVETAVRPTAPGLLVGAGAEIAAGASVGPRAVVGPGVRIGAGAEVSETVLLEGSEVGAGAKIGGSVLGPGAAVAAGVVLADTIVGRDERVSG